MTATPHEDFISYPETPLRDRFKLAYDWIPKNCRRLLDGGCSFGYGTRHFKTKAIEAWGVDPNENFIDVAQRRYPEIFFRVSGLEQTPFENGFFDVIVLNDVLEHVTHERGTLNEMHRILARDGILIITTPHRGLFSFMDPDNYVFYLRTKLPRCYRLLYRAKYGTLPPSEIKPGYEQLHRHYSQEDIVRLLNDSNFRDSYKFENIFRGGLFVGVFMSNLNEFLNLIVGIKFAGSLVKPLRWLADKDYFINYGPLAYNIGIKIRKLK